MDPATAGGLAIGVVSLAFDVFDSSVKLFKFLSSMTLAWGEAVGLIEVPKESHIAVSLGTNAVELCSIISRIAWLLGEFKDLNARWETEVSSPSWKGQAACKEEDMHMDVAKEISSLAMAYEKTQEERKYLRRTSHIIKWISKRVGHVKEVATHPFRVRWVMVDKEAFEALLKDLHSLTERIHELMGDYREKRILEVTASSYREMVIIRNDVTELRNMLDAVTNLIKTSHATDNSRINNTNDETLRDLLRLKEINHISDELMMKMRRNADFDIENDLKSLTCVKHYDADTLSKDFTYAKAASPKGLSSSYRARGSLKNQKGNSEAWIEWRSLQKIVKDSIQDKESRVRTVILAQMLHNNKPRHLYSPRCVGFIDDRENNNRYGWIFEMPPACNRDSSLKSLHSMLGNNQHKPTLTQRISLAWKLASSLLYLHTTNWLHKGIHSGNVIFVFEENRFDVEKPILSGFEYSRPQTEKTTTRSPNPQWDIYRWPGIQGEAPTSKILERHMISLALVWFFLRSRIGDRYTKSCVLKDGQSLDAKTLESVPGFWTKSLSHPSKVQTLLGNCETLLETSTGGQSAVVLLPMEK